MKPQLYYFKDHIMFLTDSEPSKPHKHLASHLVIALDDEMEWLIGEKKVTCRAIYIDANEEHVGTGKGRFLSLLFVKTSDYAYTMEQKLLQGSPYVVLDEKIAKQVCDIVTNYYEMPDAVKNARDMDALVLEACMISNLEKRNYDERIQEAIRTIESVETIDSEIIARLSKQACLSQSRFSHLFKEETGMSLASYLSFEKLRKTYHYLLDGENITNCCMKAGFDTPSHCAATCKKMFGVSLKQIALI